MVLCWIYMGILAYYITFSKCKWYSWLFDVLILNFKLCPWQLIDMPFNLATFEWPLARRCQCARGEKWRGKSQGYQHHLWQHQTHHFRQYPEITHSSHFGRSLWATRISSLWATRTCHLASRYKQTDKHTHRDISSLCNLFFPPQTNDCIILPVQAFGFR